MHWFHAFSAVWKTSSPQGGSKINQQIQLEPTRPLGVAAGFSVQSSTGLGHAICHTGLIFLTIRAQIILQRAIMGGVSKQLGNDLPKAAPQHFNRRSAAIFAVIIFRQSRLAPI
ncbi:hypothetical protein [Cypionkella aquatica]|uniref:hypothetical protein n=1 Tax=Cypionkella aquatica TaxID=1756042 RepID=UPI0024E12D8A|nr:hypothetical protein [Cypionkella aquatica]